MDGASEDRRWRVCGSMSSAGWGRVDHEVRRTVTDMDNMLFSSLTCRSGRR
ncbi:hypothetical protein AB5I41_08430 [Sphingomonas sp. MMS24-JH45]